MIKPIYCIFLVASFSVAMDNEDKQLQELAAHFERAQNYLEEGKLTLATSSYLPVAATINKKYPQQKKAFAYGALGSIRAKGTETIPKDVDKAEELFTAGISLCEENNLVKALLYTNLASLYFHNKGTLTKIENTISLAFITLNSAHTPHELINPDTLKAALHIIDAYCCKKKGNQPAASKNIELAVRFAQAAKDKFWISRSKYEYKNICNKTYPE